MSEQKLLEQAKQGNEESFLELINTTNTKVKSSIFNAYNGITQEDFKDALQIATIKAWQKLANFRGDSAFSTWFYIILKNEILNIIKTKNNVRRHEISTEEMAAYRDQNEYMHNVDYDNIYSKSISSETVMDTAQTILEKQDEVKELKGTIDSVLNKLKPSHCQIIKLIFEEGKSYKEVSDELNIPIGTVMSRLFFARKNAQKLILQYAKRNNVQLNCVGRGKESPIS
jgi:RNA polymerase sigma-70 factor (ECF subfamily)